jgi:hypothetical protein
MQSKNNPQAQKRAQPDFFNDLLEQRDEESKDDGEPPFFLSVGDTSSRTSIKPLRTNDNY